MPLNYRAVRGPQKPIQWLVLISNILWDQWLLREPLWYHCYCTLLTQNDMGIYFIVTFRPCWITVRAYDLTIILNSFEKFINNNANFWVQYITSSTSDCHCLSHTNTGCRLYGVEISDFRQSPLAISWLNGKCLAWCRESYLRIDFLSPQEGCRVFAVVFLRSRLPLTPTMTLSRRHLKLNVRRGPLRSPFGPVRT